MDFLSWPNTSLTLLGIALYFKYAHHHVVRKLNEDDETER